MDGMFLGRGFKTPLFYPVNHGKSCHHVRFLYEDFLYHILDMLVLLDEAVNLY